MLTKTRKPPLWQTWKPGVSLIFFSGPLPRSLFSKPHLLPSETLKTEADRQSENQVLRKLLDVVNQRDALIRFQEERRLREMSLGKGAQG